MKNWHNYAMKHDGKGRNPINDILTSPKAVFSRQKMGERNMQSMCCEAQLTAQHLSTFNGDL